MLNESGKSGEKILLYHNSWKEFSKVFKCLFLRKRGTERLSWGGAEREREKNTESEIGPRLQVVSTETNMGLKLGNSEIMT